jgi:hypothetical protein
VGHTDRLAKGNRYSYFQFGEAADWLDRTVDALTNSSRMLKGRIEEFRFPAGRGYQRTTVEFIQ